MQHCRAAHDFGISRPQARLPLTKMAARACGARQGLRARQGQRAGLAAGAGPVGVVCRARRALRGESGRASGLAGLREGRGRGEVQAGLALLHCHHLAR